jgi:hypothetical protein
MPVVVEFLCIVYFQEHKQTNYTYAEQVWKDLDKSDCIFECVNGHDIMEIADLRLLMSKLPQRTGFAKHFAMPYRKAIEDNLVEFQKDKSMLVMDREFPVAQINTTNRQAAANGASASYTSPASAASSANQSNVEAASSSKQGKFLARMQAAGATSTRNAAPVPVVPVVVYQNDEQETVQTSRIDNDLASTLVRMSSQVDRRDSVASVSTNATEQQQPLMIFRTSSSSAFSTPSVPDSVDSTESNLNRLSGLQIDNENDSAGMHNDAPEIEAEAPPNDEQAPGDTAMLEAADMAGSAMSVGPKQVIFFEKTRFHIFMVCTRCEKMSNRNVSFSKRRLFIVKRFF